MYYGINIFRAGGLNEGSVGFQGTSIFLGPNDDTAAANNSEKALYFSYTSSKLSQGLLD
jgi:hypothetical protein